MPDLSKLEDVALPVDSLRDALPHLRRPFALPALKWKIQTEWGRGAMVVAHIDARLVIERLNLVVAEAWSQRHTALAANLLLCELTVDGVTRQDVGQGAGKALYSDALKRAGVHFGIGVSVYALPQIRLDVGGGDAQLRTLERKQKDGSKKAVPIIDDRTLGKLRAGYETWLAKEETGEQAFGPVLAHGDVIDSQGADEDGEAPAVDQGEEQPVALPALDTPEAKDAREAIERVYAVVREKDARRMPPGEFRRKMDAAAHSLEALEDLYAEVSKLRDEVVGGA